MAVLEISTLESIRDKVEAGERLDFEDGLALLESDDLLALGELADLARRVRGGTDEVYFVQNLYLNQTNVCRVKCKFCAFAKTQKQSDAYTTTPDELVEDALRQREATGFTEIHMVNGENPHVGFDFYVDTIAKLHDAMPDVHLKCYTASEIHHMTKLSGLTHEQVLRELQDAGLGSLPGGGAEVFADRVRKLVAPGKEHPDYWFLTHDTAHRLGIPTHCTMLYGHVETHEERVDHFLRLREQQDKTGGFLAFIPLAFHPENTVFERRGFRHTTGADDLKMIAVSRLMLDNVPNIKAYWIMMGMPMAAGRAPLRRERRPGHGRARGDLPRCGRTDGDGAEDRRARALRQGGGPHSRSSATRSTTRCGAGDQARPHLVREHGAGLPPARRRRRGGGRRADRAERAADRGRDRPGADLVDRVRAQRRPAAHPPAPLRRVRGRCRLDPARLAQAARAGADGRDHAGERDLRRADEGAAPGGRARPARARRRTRSC